MKKFGKKMLSCICALTIAAGLLPVSTNAAVTPPRGCLIFESKLKPGMVMDVQGGSNRSGTNVQLYSRNNTLAQRWRFENAGGGWYYIKNDLGTYLDVQSSGTTSGTNVWAYAGNRTNAQKWQLLDAGGGYYYVKNILGNYLDVRSSGTTNGTNIWSYAKNGTNAQKWKLMNVPYIRGAAQTLPRSGGVFGLHTLAGGSYDLITAPRVSSGSYVSGGYFPIRFLNDNEQFVFTSLGGNIYKIASKANPSLVLAKSGDRVVLQYWNGSTGQKWGVYPQRDQYYYYYTIMNAAGGWLAVNVSPATGNGVNDCVVRLLNGVYSTRAQWVLYENNNT